MKTVIITNKGSIFGKKAISACLNKNIALDAVIVITQPWAYFFKLFSYVKKRVGFFQAVYFVVMRFIDGIFGKHQEFLGSIPVISDYSQLKIPVHHSEGTNSAATVSLLKSYNPDLLILGQSGICKKKILAVPVMGTLNSHPGILPDYRGIDCPQWAVYNGEYNRLGCTVHWVDSGVDTGNIISRRFYSLAGDETVDILTERIEDLSVLLLAETIASLAAGETLPSEPQSGGTQYYKMPVQKEWAVKKKLQKLRSEISMTPK